MSKPPTHYRVARDGQTFGPYIEAEVREYLASGNLVLTDLACTDGMTKWRPLSRILPKQRKNKHPLDPAGIRLACPAPPDIPWWMAFILECVTGLTFFVAWDIVEAAWLRRIEKQSRALLYTIIAAVLFIANAPALYSDVLHNLFGLPRMVSTHATVLGVAAFAMRIVARFSMRGSICRHYTHAEPIGLRLSWFMTLVFGGLYFQYHFNRLNELRRSLAASPASSGLSS